MAEKQPIVSASQQQSRNGHGPTWYVIQRTSECECEWWTGSEWSEDETQARLYSAEPDASKETLDEGAKVQVVEGNPPNFA